MEARIIVGLTHKKFALITDTVRGYMLRTLHGHVKLISDFISYVFEWMTEKRGLIIHNIWEREIAMDDA